MRLLSAALPPENERALFAYDPESIDWWDYWINIHIPALRSWCYPLIEGHARSSRGSAARLTVFPSRARGRSRRTQRRRHASHMAIFLTGATGYIGSYLAAGSARGHGESLNLLVRAGIRAKRAASVAIAAAAFRFPGVSRAPERAHPHFSRRSHQRRNSAWPTTNYHALVDIDRFGHCTARLRSIANPKKAASTSICAARWKSCSWRGARRIARTAALFASVSTVAVAGQAQQRSGDRRRAPSTGSRSDYDPYARTKKFCEHMVRELLPDVPRTIFRPRIVLGDSRRPETTQFDMVRAFVFLRALPCAAAAS